PSVRTDPDVGWYRRVRMVRVRRAAFLQVGHWRDALRRGTTVVDLNPRSLTAWLLLVLRRATGRRVLVWGHVHPRAGQGARTAPVRRLMRRLAHGTVSYTVADAADARADLPGSPVWVATNALYRRDDIRVPAGDEVGERDHLVFVGRFVRAKKVDLLVRAFAVARQARPGMRLTLVGDGELRPELERFVREQGLQDAVTFAGWVDDVDALRAVHARAFAAVSPGFAGLSLTQAAGFGVPTLVSRDEPHSPEIELADHGAVRWFPTDSVEGLATAALAALTNEQMMNALEHVGAVICQAGSGLAPADRLLYALRDVTGTVESIPLIASSIMSKKIAEGTGALVLDVKVGSGAFMKELDSARELARTMVDLGTDAGVRTVALLTDMSTPLGLTAGNALEVRESVEVMKGEGPQDVVDLTVALALE